MGVTGVKGMYGLYGVGIPVRGPPGTWTGLSRIVVFVGGALMGGLNWRKGKVELLLLILSGAGGLARILLGVLMGWSMKPLGVWMGLEPGKGAVGGGPGL